MLYLVFFFSYWDPRYDLQLMQDNIALNLLYIQTVSDIECDWIIATQDVKDQMASLQDRGNKKEVSKNCIAITYIFVYNFFRHQKLNFLQNNPVFNLSE